MTPEQPSAELVSPAPDSNAPLLSLEWSDVQVFVTVVGAPTAKTDLRLYPEPCSDLIPSRKSLTSLSKLKVHVGTATSAASAVTAASASAKPRSKFTCRICQKIFPSPVELRRHLTTHSNVKPHKCTICNKGFFQTKNLWRHMRDAHGTQPQTGPFRKLGPTNGQVKSNDAADRMRTLSNGSVLAGVGLDDAEQTSSSESASVSLSVEARWFSCTSCHARFQKLSALNNHIKIHDT